MLAQSLFPRVTNLVPPRRLGQILPAEAPESAAIMAQLRSLADTINVERAAAAAAFVEQTTAGARRLNAVDATGKAERSLAEQQKIWEQSHRNADALAAAQAAVDAAYAEQNAAAQEVAEKKQAVQDQDQKVSRIRGDVDDLINSLPAEMQPDAHKIIDPCWSPRMKGSEPVRISRPATGPIQSLSAIPRPNSVSLAGMYRPGYSSPVLMPAGNFRSQIKQLPVFGQRMGQGLVTVNPNVNLTIQTGIEKYMFPIGLMAGGAASFLVGSVIPENFRPITTVIGLGLIGWGVYTLVKGGTAGAQAAPSAPPQPPTGSAPAAASPGAFTPPTVSAFSQLQFELVSPKADQTIEHLGNLFTSDRIPVVLRMYNPTSEKVTFNLDFEWDEFPSMIGYNRAPNHGSKAFQMTLGPNEEKNEPFELPYQSSGFGTSSMSVDLAIYKKRTPTENPMLISNTTFNVS